MRIAAIHVGDELLDGRVADANLLALGAFAATRDATVVSATFVPDDIDAIAATLAAAEADIIVCSGGLGPTVDDLTRHAAAAWAGVELAEDADTLARIKARFAQRQRTFTPNNARQALFPVGAEILDTEVGTAAGFSLEVGGTRAFFFPGVPREFVWFVENVIARQVGARREGSVVRTLHFHGIGESSLEERVGAFSGVTVGYRADYPVIEIKLAGPKTAVVAAEKQARDAAGEFLVGVDETLVERVARTLLERGETVTTAESCTAGKISAALTDLSGSSAWFGRGFVTYSNDAKVELLGVLEPTLERHGAVSPQVAAQMALGAQRAARADWAVAVSGIAGPTGGTPEKPVGTVDFALAGPDGVWTRRYQYGPWSRAFIRAGTTYTALQLLLWGLDGVLQARPVSGPFAPDDVMSDDGIDDPTEAR